MWVYVCTVCAALCVPAGAAAGGGAAAGPGPQDFARGVCIAVLVWHLNYERAAIVLCLAVLQAQLQAVVQQLDLAPGICRRGQPMEVRHSLHSIISTAAAAPAAVAVAAGPSA